MHLRQRFLGIQKEIDSPRAGNVALIEWLLHLLNSSRTDWEEAGAGDGDRTRDIRLGKPTFYR